MASRRARLRTARRDTFRDLVEYLERDRSMSGSDQIEAIDALIIEFRRRGRLTPPGPPPDHASLPGLEVAHD